MGSSFRSVQGLDCSVQVAMMFLTRGEIHQEPLWALWFQHLAGLVPVSALRVSQQAIMTALPGVLCEHVYSGPKLTGTERITFIYQLSAIAPLISACIQIQHHHQIQVADGLCIGIWNVHDL